MAETKEQKNKVKYGLCDVQIAVITGESEDGYTYDTPFHIPGAVSLSLDPEGDSADFKADNTKYFTDTANQGYSGSLEMALYTDEFRTKVLGEKTDANGALIEDASAPIKKFALGFRVDGDKHNRKHWLYNVSASRPKLESETIDSSKEPKTDSIDIVASPRQSDNLVRVSMEESTVNASAYKSFFDKVYEEVPKA